MPPTLRLGAVHLTVADLDRSIAFYEDAIGLRLQRREIHRGLAEMYVSEERFRSHYDKRAPGLASFVREAVLANAERAEKGGAQ